MTGSISWRRRARERRRSLRSTSASHHSVPTPDGRNSPSSTRPRWARRCRVWRATASPRPEPGGHLGGGEGAVAAGVAGDEVADRVLGELGEGVGGADRDGYAEPVAQAADVLDRGPAVLAGHPDDGHATVERGEPALHVGAVDRPGPDLLHRQRTDEAQQVGDRLGVAGATVGGEPLQLGLDLGEHLRVEQLAQLGAAEQLGEQALVEGERGGPALGDGGVALVDELGDVAEEQAAGERAGRGWWRRRGR